ncbi:MAG TPA: pyruvate formate-lyase-activating protein [Gemmataceae bacterium]|jgi:pyruvate formate lyase activating enzyme|nr:pyruvate formate-lyase-activating protein [Gemmataceae bacterium]
MAIELPTSDVPLIGSPYDLRVGLGEKAGTTDIKSAVESGDWGFIHSFQAGSAVDGPGMRLVAWLSGCQFQCLFCHNPDTWKLTNGIPVTLARAIEVVGQYRHDLKVMKGGLTVSGGEPLMQHRFVLRLFEAARQQGVHTALDTNGYLGDRLTDTDLLQIDLVLLGLKAMSPDVHKRLTGKDTVPVHAFARRLAALRRPVRIRFVVVPGFTDDLDEVGRMADFAAELGNVERVDVLPFHQLGRFKWEQLGMDYQLKDATPPTSEVVARVVERFKTAGLDAV